MEYLEIVPGTLPTRELHQYLLGSVAPRPIAFASTISRDGIPNLSPFSFFNVFGSNPPVMIFSPARRVRDNTTKDTLSNVYEVPEVVINVVPASLIDISNLASAEFSKGVDEFEKSGLHKLPSDTVRPFRVAESPVQMECEVIGVQPLARTAGAGNLIFCKLLKMHVSKAVLKADGLIDPFKINLAGRMSENYWCVTDEHSVVQIDKALLTAAIGIDGLPDYIRESDILTGSDLARLANVAALPAHEEISAFAEKEKSGLLANAHSPEAVHRLARELLVQNQRDLALRVLLSQPLLMP